MAPYLTSIYVSGWQCSSTASTTNEPGPDLAGKNTVTIPVTYNSRLPNGHCSKQS